MYGKKTPIRSKHNSLRKPGILSITLALVVISFLGILCFKTDSSASSSINREKCYKSIEIQAGDSLWNIAKEHYTSDWDSLESYIEEIKAFNGLIGEEINFDNYISIPYYIDVTQ